MEKPTINKERHDLIQGEFRDALKMYKEDIKLIKEYKLPFDTDAIMVLSAPHSSEEKDERLREGNPENEAIILYSIEVLRKIAAEKLNKKEEDITKEDLKDNAVPRLILNGETEQLPTMRAIAIENGIPEEKIQDVNSGDRGVSNSKTQFEKVSNLIKDGDFGTSKHLTLVSSAYHTPRIARTAETNLPKNINFEVLGVPYKDYSFNVFKIVRGEVKRIEMYGDNGDIARRLEQPAEMLTPLGADIKSIDYKHTDENLSYVNEEVTSLREKLESTLAKKKENGEDVPFSGPLVNVDSIEYDEATGTLKLETSQTNYFTYLASSFTYRGKQEENPIKPLAVSITMVTPDDSLIFERRTNVTEMDGLFHVFGSSLKPGETPEISIIRVMQDKLGIALDDSNELKLTGVDRENIQNIVEIFYTVKLTNKQVEDFHNKFKGEDGNLVKDIQELSTDKESLDIEHNFENQDLTDWNPSGLYNIMYALARNDFRSVEEVDFIIEFLRKKIWRKPWRDVYPIETLLKDRTE